MCDNCDKAREELRKDHPEGCTCQQPECPDATLKGMKEMITSRPVRIMIDENEPATDEEGGKNFYVHIDDVGTALAACIRLNELANVAQAEIMGMEPPPELKLLTAAQAALAVNVGQVLFREENHVDVSKPVEIPDEIPVDWFGLNDGDEPKPE